MVNRVLVSKVYLLFISTKRKFSLKNFNLSRYLNTKTTRPKKVNSSLQQMIRQLKYQKRIMQLIYEAVGRELDNS